MEYRFKADEWERLAPAERIRRCRLLAAEAATLAKSAPHKMKESCLSIANEWLKLARDIEEAAESKSGSQTPT